MNSVIILAAGQGRRFQSNIPKQFMTIDGRQMLSFSVKTFSEHPLIDEVIITTSKKDIDQVKIDYSGCKVILGGDSRQGSATNGVNALAPGTKNVLVHDSARPFVTNELITECIKSLDNFDGAAPIQNPNDSLIIFENNQPGHVEREKIKAVQTPQAFKVDILKAAQQSGLETTDEVGLVFMYKPDAKINFFKGNSFNFKITTRMDFYLAEQLMRSKIYLNQSDFDATNKRALILGGTSGIGDAISRRLLSFGADVTVAGSEIRIQNKNSLDRFEDQSWDIIVHSMGVMKIGDRSIIELVENLSYSEWDEGLKINLTSAFLVAKLALKTMTNGGHLLFIGSSSAKRGRRKFGLYSAAKAGVVNFVQSISEEFEDRQIMVNCINPSRTLTKMRSVFTGEDPLKMLSPKRVAEIATSYCHGHLTGQVFDLRVGD
ncbi:MAG: 2-C-methyl-D-erythritol 4-phosphate cytidylyltransferase [Fidelibacterota bacterium]